MAQFKITVPDEQAAALVQAFASVLGYKPTVLDDKGLEMPNPDSPNKFWTDKTAEYWQSVYNQYVEAVSSEAANAARETARKALPDFTVELTAEAVQ